MENYVIYFMITDGLMETIEEVKATFPCFISSRIVEMNCIELTVKARVEDSEAIDKKFAPFI